MIMSRLNDDMGVLYVSSVNKCLLGCCVFPPTVDALCLYRKGRQVFLCLGMSQKTAISPEDSTLCDNLLARVHESSVDSKCDFVLLAQCLDVRPGEYLSTDTNFDGIVKASRVALGMVESSWCLIMLRCSRLR